MALNRTHSMFVPPDVLNSLARSRVAPARLSIQQSVQSRTKRTNKVLPMTKLAGAVPSGKAPRKVYDCDNKWDLRLKLARGEKDPAAADEIVNQAYDYIGAAREYFSKVLIRNSYDDVGSEIIVNAHVGVDYLNAFWDGDEIALGDGDGEIFVSFARSLEVVAHEFSHGVVQFTAGLVYQDQSGALNESFADVFGSAITQYVEKQKAADADWLIGDEIMGPSLIGESLRSMRYPGTAFDNPLMGKDQQRAHMDDFYDGPEDNGGVHWNSGIPNRAFCRAARQIGTDEAARIWYRALRNLWPTANFNEAVWEIADSAAVLAEAGKVPLGSKEVVRGAFGEVGLPK